MVRLKNKRVILALLIIFICGLVTGFALSPFMVHYSRVGNPFHKDSLSEHLFFTNHLDWSKLDNTTSSKLKNLIDRKRRDYENALEIFRLESSDVFDDFADELKQILPEERYDEYMKYVEIEKNKRNKRVEKLLKKD